MARTLPTSEASLARIDELSAERAAEALAAVIEASLLASEETKEK